MSRSRWAIVVGIVSVAILAPTLLSLLTAGALTGDPGTDEFYGAAVGVLSALVVAYALQFQMFLTGLYRLVGRGDRLLILPVLVGYFVVLTAGVGFSLSALQDCSGGICGGSAEMSNVVFALISGGIYLFAAFAVGAVEGERDDRGD